MTIDEYMEAPEAKSEDELFNMPLAGMTVAELVSARSRIEAEMRRRDIELTRDHALVRRALGLKVPGVKPAITPTGRKTRVDADLPRGRRRTARSEDAGEAAP